LPVKELEDPLSQSRELIAAAKKRKGQIQNGLPFLLNDKEKLLEIVRRAGNYFYLYR